MRNTVSNLAVVMALSIAAPALAQTTSAETPDLGGDIVVTATRSETLASKTPVTLTAITGDGLIKSGTSNVALLGEQVPGLSIDRSTGGIQITIRGVTSGDMTEKGDPSAAFLLDGIYIARPQAQEVSFFDISRVEVLRGPQGTLFGRNTTAGVIQVISNEPVNRFEASVDGAIGNYGTRQVTGMVNVPVTSSLAVRAAVNYDRRDSYLRAGSNVSSDLSPYKDNISARLSAKQTWDSGELVLRGDYSHMGGKTANMLLASNFYTNLNVTGVDATYAPSGNKQNQLTLNSPVDFDLSRDNQTWGAMAELTQAVGPLTFTYLGSYREFTRDESQNLLATSGKAAYQLTYNGQYWQNSQELRLAGEFGHLKIQVGGYYFKEQSRIVQNVLGLLSSTPGTTGYVYSFNRNPTRSESYAGFTQATYSILPTLRATGGFRYSYDRRSRNGYLGRCSTTACDASTDIKSPNVANVSYSKPTWKIGLDADVTPRTLVYGTIATGYKSGGYNDGCLATDSGCSSPLPSNALYYKPETLVSYELGFKSRVGGNALQINGSMFHYDYSNLQLSQTSNICGAPCNVTTNAAKAKVDGVEIESTMRPSPRNAVNLTATWLHARYTEFEPLPGYSFAGKDLDRSPRWTIIAGYTYKVPLANGADLSANVQSRFSSGYVLAALSSASQLHQPSYTKTNLSLTYTAPSSAWYLQGFVSNLENSIVISSAVSGSYSTVQVSEPRMFGARGGMKF